MTKSDLLKLLEPLYDTDIIHCQVNYTTSKTDKSQIMPKLFTILQKFIKFIHIRFKQQQTLKI